MSENHEALTTIRRDAYDKLFGNTLSYSFYPHVLFKKPDERFHIDIYVYTLEADCGEIEAAVANGMSDHRMIDPNAPRIGARRELIQHLPKCTEGHARLLHNLAWLPLFDGILLDTCHSVAWGEPAVPGTPWKMRSFLPRSSSRTENVSAKSKVIRSTSSGIFRFQTRSEPTSRNTVPMR